MTGCFKSKEKKAPGKVSRMSSHVGMLNNAKRLPPIATCSLATASSRAWA